MPPLHALAARIGGTVEGNYIRVPNGGTVYAPLGVVRYTRAGEAVTLGRWNTPVDVLAASFRAACEVTA